MQDRNPLDRRTLLRRTGGPYIRVMNGPNASSGLSPLYPNLLTSVSVVGKSLPWPKPDGTPQLRAAQYAPLLAFARDQGSRSVILSR